MTGLLIFIGIVLGLLILYIIYKFFLMDKHEEALLEDELSDEYIIDPESGTKITLEEAESGNWTPINEPLVPMTETELESLAYEEDVQFQKSINYLLMSGKYTESTLDDRQIETLNETVLLRKYNAWSYSNPFKINQYPGFFIPVIVHLNATSKYQTNYEEAQCLFWLKMEKDLGHYFFKEQLLEDKLFKPTSPSEIMVPKIYKCICYQRTENTQYLNSLLEKFDGQDQLEIEVMGDALFIKTRKLINQEDIMRIEQIVKQLY